MGNITLGNGKYDLWLGMFIFSGTVIKFPGHILGHKTTRRGKGIKLKCQRRELVALLSEARSRKQRNFSTKNIKKFFNKNTNTDSVCVEG